MYARITRFKMKPGSKDAAAAILHSAKGEILSLPGMVQFIDAINDDGTGYVIALTNTAEPTAETQEKIKSIWAKFGDHLEAIPTPETFEVLANWKTAVDA